VPVALQAGCGINLLRKVGLFCMCSTVAVLQAGCGSTLLNEVLLVHGRLLLLLPHSLTSAVHDI
jgi:UPF0716 family protein affecting phage T7 exclusion